jgi:hypothetical protein
MQHLPGTKNVSNYICTEEKITQVTHIKLCKNVTLFEITKQTDALIIFLNFYNTILTVKGQSSTVTGPV